MKSYRIVALGIALLVGCNFGEVSDDYGPFIDAVENVRPFPALQWNGLSGQVEGKGEDSNDEGLGFRWGYRAKVRTSKSCGGIAGNCRYQGGIILSASPAVTGGEQFSLKGTPASLRQAFELVSATTVDCGQPVVLRAPDDERRSVSLRFSEDVPCTKLKEILDSAERTQHEVRLAFVSAPPISELQVVSVGVASVR